MVATQTTDILVNQHIKYDTVGWSRGTNITLNLGAYPDLGRFTLLAGTYQLFADFSIHTQTANSEIVI